MSAILKITDGETEINLLNLPGYQLSSWRPSVAGYKGGGTWRQSALSDGRRLVDRQFTNIIDTFNFKMMQVDTDSSYYDFQELVRMLERAADYWAAAWPTQYVYIIAQAEHETNPRYAIVQAGTVPDYENPYAQPFLQPDCIAVMDNMTVIVEHGHWLDSTVEDAACLEIGATQAWCASYPLVFDGADSYVDLSSPAALDDLPGADFTIDGWIKAAGYGEGNAGRIFDKSSWFFTVNSTVGLRAFADFDVLDAEAQSLVSALTLNTWIHVAAVWNQANSQFTLYIDGEDVTNFQQAGGAVYQTDAAQTAYIGSNGGPGNRTFDGSIGWLRITSAELWTSEFTPPARCILPTATADTEWLGIYEGTPDTPGVGDITDLSGNGNDGDASDCTWDDCCNVNYGNYLPCSPRYVVYDGADSIVNLGSNAVLDNLVNSDFTMDTWIRADTFGENNSGRIMSKNDDWYAAVASFGGIQTFANFGGVDAFTWTDGSLLDVGDGEWYHIAVVWDASSKVFDIFINGQRGTYGGRTPATGAYTGDAAENMYIGNRGARNRTFDGDIGWLRLTTGKLWTDGFTAPARCTIPTPTTDTIGIWNYVDDDTMYNFAGTTTFSTLEDVANDCDCNTAAREETCAEGVVYVANKGNKAQLSHIFIEDGGTFGNNLLSQGLPYPLLPAVPAANDRVYFGIDTTIEDSGPFCSLVFDLQSAQADIADIVWEYWNGAWVALTVQDNTDADGEMTGAAFDTTGVKSVHWIQPSDWVTTAVNGITGYWVRAEVQDAGTAPPIQQNRQIYTIVWPYMEVQSNRVGGDLPALIRQYIRNQSDDPGSVDLYSNRCLVGLRTVDRGENFNAYINLGDEQHPEGITTTIGGATFAFATDVQSPSGRIVRGTNIPIGGDVAVIVTWDATIAQEYFGKYHVFLRVYQTSGSAGDIEVQIRGSVGSASDQNLSDWLPTQTTSDWELMDLGLISFPFTSSLNPNEIGIVDLSLYARGDGAADCDFYDFILLPVDEWALDSFDIDPERVLSVSLGGRKAPNSANAYLDIDSITWPKNRAKTLLKKFATDLLDNNWQPIINGDAIAQANATQRYWFLHVTSGASQFEIVNSLQMWRLQRYRGSRGAR